MVFNEKRASLIHNLITQVLLIKMLYFVVDQKQFVCPFHFVAQSIKKTYTQELSFNKISNFHYFIKDTLK